MGFGNIKHMPLIIQVLSLVLFLIAWIPIAEFLMLLGVKPVLALAISGIVILSPAMFLIGLGTNKKLFLACALAIGALLLIAFLFP